LRADPDAGIALIFCRSFDRKLNSPLRMLENKFRRSFPLTRDKLIQPSGIFPRNDPWHLASARRTLTRGRQMNSYSIVRIGDDYVVRADDKNVLKVASRRRAAQLVTDAAELLNAQPQPAVEPELSSTEESEAPAEEAEVS
jgi:hypothetical protein